MTPCLNTKVVDDLLIGNSRLMCTLRRSAEAAGRSSQPVVIEGERGVGKDTLAKAIHLYSGSPETTFTTVRCAAGGGLVLFDAVGSMTLSEWNDIRASGVETIFFDDVGELDPEGQTRLLHVLQKIRPYDVRIICASTVSLRSKALKATFRTDLYEMINGITLTVPPLRQRRLDIPLLALHFLKRYSAAYRITKAPFSSDLMELFLIADWPGNVRELERTVERCVRDRGEDLLIAEFRSSIHEQFWNRDEPLSLKNMRREVVRDCDCKAILVSLTRSNWNRRHVAHELQISYRSLLNAMKDLGLPAKRRTSKRGESTDTQMHCDPSGPLSPVTTPQVHI